MADASIGSFFGSDRPMNGTIKGPILALGAAGELGRGVIGSLLEAGWPVIAVDREPAALALAHVAAHGLGRLSTLAGSVASDADGAELARAARSLRRPLGGVVALFGGEFTPGRVLDHDSRRLRDKLDDDLLPHVVAARHLLPVLADSGRPSTYLILGGPAAETPWSGYGHLSVASAALRTLTRVLDDEMRGTSVRVRQLSVCTPVRTDANRAHACIDWPNAYEVGHRIAELMAAPPAEIVAYLQRRRRALTAPAHDRTSSPSGEECRIDAASNDQSTERTTSHAPFSALDPSP